MEFDLQLIVKVVMVKVLLNKSVVLKYEMGNFGRNGAKWAISGRKGAKWATFGRNGPDK